MCLRETRFVFLQYSIEYVTSVSQLDHDAICCYAIGNVPGQTCSQNRNEFNTPFKLERKVFQILEHIC